MSPIRRLQASEYTIKQPKVCGVLPYKPWLSHTVGAFETLFSKTPLLGTAAFSLPSNRLRETSSTCD